MFCSRSQSWVKVFHGAFSPGTLNRMLLSPVGCTLKTFKVAVYTVHERDICIMRPTIPKIRFAVDPRTGFGPLNLHVMRSLLGPYPPKNKFHPIIPKIRSVRNPKTVLSRTSPTRYNTLFSVRSCKNNFQSTIPTLRFAKYLKKDFWPCT